MREVSKTFDVKDGPIKFTKFLSEAAAMKESPGPGALNCCSASAATTACETVCR